MVDHDLDNGSHTDLVRHTEWARRLARRLVRDAARADDLAQDALIARLKGGASGKAEGRAWLGGVVRKLALQSRRSDRRRGAREEARARPVVAADSSTLVAEAEAQRSLREHVLALGDPHSDVLVRTYFEGLRPAEIAAQDGTTAVAVSARLTRARAALRARLESTGGRERWLAALAPLVIPRESAKTHRLLASGFVASWGMTIVGPVLALSIAVVIAAFVFWNAGGATNFTVSLPHSSGAEDGPRGDRSGVVLSEAAREPGFGDHEIDVALERHPGRRSPMAFGAGVLEGTVTTGAGIPIPGAHVRLIGPDGTSRMSTSGVDGVAAFENLGVGLEYEVLVKLDGSDLEHEMSSIQLEDGDRVQRVWPILTSASIRGKTIDGAGIAVPHQYVRIDKYDDRIGWDLTSNDMGSPTAHTISDANGEFSFYGVQAGRYRIGPMQRYPAGARRRAGEDSSKRRIRGRPRIEDAGCQLTPAFIVPPGADSLHVDVAIHRELWITGRTVSPDGDGLAGVTVHARVEGLRSGLVTRSDSDGHFSLGPLPPMQFQLVGFGYDSGWIWEEQVTAQAGDDGIQLRMMRGAAVRGRVTAANGQSVKSDNVALTPVGGHAEPFAGARAEVDRATGRFELRWVRPGNYALTYMSTTEPLAGQKDGFALLAGDTLEGVELRAYPAGRVVVHSDRAMDFSISVDCGGARFVPDRVFPKARQVLHLPPGPFSISIPRNGTGPEERWEGIASLNQEAEVLIGAR